MSEQVIGTFMFTDVKMSSKLRSKHGNSKMDKALSEHYKRMYKIVNEYGGVIVKTVGDEFVIFFRYNDMQLPLFCGIAIQTDLIKNPIVIGGTDRLRIRMGAGFGEAKKIDMITQRIVKKPKFDSVRRFVRSRLMKIEPFKQVNINGTTKYIESFHNDDYLGDILNVASRMESNVSKPDGIAFTIENIENVPKDRIARLLEKLEEETLKNGFQPVIQVKEYNNEKCNPWYVKLFNREEPELCLQKLNLRNTNTFTAFTLEFKRYS